MAMMISKFHKLVQSKKVWGAFAVLISCAFIFAFNGARGSGSNGADAGKEVLGTIGGKDVTQREFALAVRDSKLAYVLMTNSAIPNSEEVYRELTNSAWQRLVLLNRAEQMGIEAPRNLVDQWVARLFTNPETSQFDESYMANFLNEILPSLNIRCSQEEFDEFGRRQIVLGMLQDMVTQGALVAEQEVEDAFHLVNDELTVAYAVLPLAAAPNPEVTPEDAVEYYNANTKEFSYPAKTKVNLVAFSAADYTNAVTATDEEIAQSYEMNKQFYANPLPEGVTNVTEITYQPLEEVKDSIAAELIQKKAMTLAGQSADQFMVSMGSGSVPLATVAENAGISVVSPYPFAMDEPMNKVNESERYAKQLSRLAFSLPTRAQSPNRCFSNSLRCENGYYIMEVTERFEAMLPERFEDVEEKVMERVIKIAKGKAYGDLVLQKVEDAEQAIAAGQTFEEVMKTAGLEISTVGPFSQKTLPPQRELSYMIQYGTITQDVLVELGSLTQALGSVNKIDLGEDGYALTYVAEKNAADFLTASADEIASINAKLRQAKGMALFDDWKKAAMKSDLKLEPTQNKG